MNIKKWGIGGLLSLLLLGNACTKESADPIMPEPIVRERSSEGKLRDSTYFYTYYFYLWQKDLPERFPTDRYKTAEDVLEALKGYAKRPGGELYDRFSFLDRTGTVRSEIQEGQLGDLGLDVRYGHNDHLYIKKVLPGSPAALSGLKRGQRILELNNVKDLSYEKMEADDFQFLINSLNAQSMNIRVEDSESFKQTQHTLRAAQYRYNPILAQKVIPLDKGKVGYLALDLFVSTLNNNNTPSYMQVILDEINASFEAADVKYVVVDLRYNGGGAVITADYLTNMLAPKRANNELMYTYKINSMLELEGWGNTVFAPEYIRKKNQLDLEQVFFIVTPSTASASELLINNLKPHLPVKLFGENRTYGKPVGYFGWDILGVDLYAVSFQTINALGEGDYFDGLPVDFVIGEDVLHDFGDHRERILGEVLYYIENGSPLWSRTTSTSLLASKSLTLPDQAAKNHLLDSRGIKNMYFLNKRGN
jgi:carboxyl-terminal processing protease